MSNSYQGKVLQYIMPEGILEEGEIVYCFTEDEEMWIDEAVNHAIWARGIQKPPRKIRLVVTREEGFPIEVKLVEE